MFQYGPNKPKLNVQTLIRQNCHFTIRELEDKMVICICLVHSILSKDLVTSKVSAKLMSKLLTMEQKQ